MFTYLISRKIFENDKMKYEKRKITKNNNNNIKTTAPTIGNGQQQQQQQQQRIYRTNIPHINTPHTQIA